MRASARHPALRCLVLVAVLRHRINIILAMGALRLPRGYSPAQASQYFTVALRLPRRLKSGTSVAAHHCRRRSDRPKWPGRRRPTREGVSRECERRSSLHPSLSREGTLILATLNCLLAQSGGRRVVHFWITYVRDHLCPPDLRSPAQVFIFIFVWVECFSQWMVRVYVTLPRS